MLSILFNAFVIAPHPTATAEGGGEINLILQTNSKGCAVAVIAMVAGEDYQSVKSRLFGELGEIRGLYMKQELKPQIEKAGFDVAVEYLSEFTEPEKFTSPVDGASIVFELMVFKDSPCSHFVVMDEKGNVLDPMFGQREWSFYHKPPYARLVCKKKEIV